MISAIHAQNLESVHVNYAFVSVFLSSGYWILV